MNKTESQSSLMTIVRLGVVLLIMAAAVALVLGLVNLVTEGRIESIRQETMNAAMQEVLPSAGGYSPAEIRSGNEAVDAVYAAANGWVVQCTVSGSQGSITLMVGVDTSYTCTGISITEHSETAGLGAIAGQAGEKGEAFRSQFVGQSGTVAVTKNGGSIDAIAGATITSNAVCSAVTYALQEAQAQSGIAVTAVASGETAQAAVTTSGETVAVIDGGTAQAASGDITAANGETVAVQSAETAAASGDTAAAASGETAAVTAASAG